MKKVQSSVRKKHLLISCILSVMIMILSGCASDGEGKETTSETTTKKILNIDMGHNPVEPVYKCDAEILANMDIDYTPFIDIDAKLGEQSFIDECKESYGLVATEEDSALYGSKGCFVSKTPIYAYNLNDEGLARVMICYVFNEDKLCAGEISFNLNEGGVLTVFSFARSNSVDRNLRTMMESPDEKFIKILNNRSNTIIDENSKPLDIAFKMTGDVFHTLNYEFLGVSYNDIVKNMVWIEFD